MNKLPCGRCEHFDPILGPYRKDTKMAWCAKRSKYPAHEGPGQVFPANVVRVAAGALAEPYIVRPDTVEEMCTTVRETDRDQLADKRIAERGDTVDEKGLPILE